MKYRKKPIVIEAFKLKNKGLIKEDWFWDAVQNGTINPHNFETFNSRPAWCEINTLEGTMIVRAGDYIIRGIDGEIYPCKAEIFEKTYEVAE